MKSFWLALASVASALAATLCCLPALLFLIFGASFSLLSSEAIESLTELRPYFTALAAICFAASAFYFFKKLIFKFLVKKRFRLIKKNNVRRRNKSPSN